MGTEIDIGFQFPVTINELEQILPHRYPFLLVDRWTEASGGSVENRTGRKVKAYKNLTYNEPFFQGHFPGNPIMPGVLSLEALAQAAGLSAYVPIDDSCRYDFYIVSADKVRYRRPIVPGDRLDMEVEIIKDRGKMIVFDCKGYVDGELASSAQIMANVVVVKK